MFFLSHPVWKRLIVEFRPYRGASIGALFFGLIASAIQPIAVRMSQGLIDGLKAGQGFEKVREIPFQLVGLFLVSGVARFLYQNMRRIVTERVVAKYRDAVFRRLLRLPLTSLDRRHGGELSSLLQTDLVQVNQGIETAWFLFKEPITFLGLLAVAFYSDWQLTLFALCAAPIVIYLFSWSGKSVKRYTRKSLSEFGEMMTLAQESVSGARVVKAFGLEGALETRFTEGQDRYLVQVRKSIAVQEMASPMVEFVGALLVAAIFTFGGYRAAQGLMTPGDLVAFLLAIGLLQMPIKQMNNAYVRLKGAQAALERVQNVLAEPIEMPVGVPVLAPLATDTPIRFDGVRLKFGTKEALRGVDLTVHRGERLAIVGGSGSGKSSLVSLVPRLYDVSAGTVYVDGVDVRTWAVDQLRQRVSIVAQDTFLFHGTIEENVRVARPEADQAAVKRALEMADCGDFLSRAQHGLQTMVGERGLSLSGGERQRLAIARALLKDEPILILDEATSNLDSESEQRVQHALDELIKGRTVLQVAHRFSAIRNADRILVLHEGRLEALGSHSELVTKSSIYRGLFERQQLAPDA